MSNREFKIKLPDEPIGVLEHKATHSCVSVYHKINWFRRMMLKLCFDFNYKKL